MGGLAQLGRALGHDISGCDEHVYPPMSTQLEAAGIEIMQGYNAEHLQACNGGRGPDLVVIGNALSRGNPMVEAVLDRGLRYISGPQWLAETVLKDRWVLAVAGTHGKTTTASILAWLLEAAGLQPGFLIGGVPNNFGVSARLGEAPFFVIEADEYDTAFFDKRSKFVHYRPRTLVLNNLEFDHADIFPDLDAIKRQFHYLLRIVPASGLLVVNNEDQNLQDVLEQGCWTPVQHFSSVAGTDDDADWHAEMQNSAAESFDVYRQAELEGTVEWSLTGVHNVQNGLAAIIAARHAGVQPAIAIDALSRFTGVKRRLELRGKVNGVSVYDDFAHHPTAIETTLAGLRGKVGAEARIIAVLEPRSNTMRMGVHTSQLIPSLQQADLVWIYQPDSLRLGLENFIGERVQVSPSVDAIVNDISRKIRAGDHILIMSNGGFEGVHAKLLEVLRVSQGSEHPL